MKAVHTKAFSFHKYVNIATSDFAKFSAQNRIPIELKSFLTATVDMTPVDRSLSAISGHTFIIAQRPINGSAE